MRSPNRLPYAALNVLNSPTINGDITLDKGGTIKTTENGNITLEPHGTGEVVGAGGVDTSQVITFDTSLYVRTIPMAVYAAMLTPGQEAVQVIVSSTTMGGWTMGNNLVIVACKARMFSDWDGVSDPWINMSAECLQDNSGGNGTEITVVQGDVRHKADGDIVTKYTSIDTDFTWAIKGIYQQKTNKIYIDHDKVDNVLSPNSLIAVRWYTKTTESDINDIRITELSLSYLTKEIHCIAE